MRLKAKSLLIRPVSEAYEGDAVAASPSSFLAPRSGALTGASMFPDLARDDVFRIETARLWLRWPRIGDAAAMHKYVSQWEVARYTARIPHPYPPGSAERFIYAAREANASGRDLTLVMTPIKGKRDAIGSISLESRGKDRLALGYVLAPKDWGKGLATEAALAMIDAGFGLTPAVEILASVRVENEASRAVVGKCGFTLLSTGPQGAPARGGMVDCHSFRLGRAAWAEAGAQRRKESSDLARAS
jgi:RimJ/RimL family protein N-acetyltransferase